MTVEVGQSRFMRKTYYLTKSIVSIPCMGLLPLGVYAIYLSVARADYGVGVLFAALVAAYVWIVWNLCSPVVNPAFIKSADSPRVFIWVNVVITVAITLVVLLIGTFLWPLWYRFSLWFGNNLLDLQMGERTEFLWVYLLSNTLFHIVYLRLWEYLRLHRWVRRLTLPNMCW